MRSVEVNPGGGVFVTSDRSKEAKLCESASILLRLILMCLAREVYREINARLIVNSASYLCYPVSSTTIILPLAPYDCNDPHVCFSFNATRK